MLEREPVELVQKSAPSTVIAVPFSNLFIGNKSRLSNTVAFVLLKENDVHKFWNVPIASRK